MFKLIVTVGDLRAALGAASGDPIEFRYRDAVCAVTASWPGDRPVPAAFTLAFTLRVVDPTSTASYDRPLIMTVVDALMAVRGVADSQLIQVFRFDIAKRLVAVSDRAFELKDW